MERWRVAVNPAHRDMPQAILTSISLCTESLSCLNTRQSAVLALLFSFPSLTLQRRQRTLARHRSNAIPHSSLHSLPNLTSTTRNNLHAPSAVCIARGTRAHQRSNARQRSLASSALRIAQPRPKQSQRPTQRPAGRLSGHRSPERARRKPASLTPHSLVVGVRARASPLPSLHTL